MATPMPSNSPLAVKLWGIKGSLEVTKQSFMGRAIQTGSIVRASELDKARRGDEVTLDFTGRLTAIGVTEGGTMQGNEEFLDNQSFTMRYGIMRNAVRNPNDDTIEQQRTYINFEERTRKQLEGWTASRVDASFFNQVAGVDSDTITVDGTIYSGANKTIVQGLNTVTAPTSNRIIRAGGQANDESLTSSDTFTLDLIDAAIEKLSSSYPTVEPLDNEEFDLVVSYEQMTDLKRDTSGKIQWYLNNLAMVEGGKTSDNMINDINYYSAKPIGKYANVNIFARFRVATGVNSSTNAAIPNVRRAVLLGRDAVGFASAFSGMITDLTGETNEKVVPFKFYTDLTQDYQYTKGIEARMIYGIKKKVFGGEDFGSLVISTYAAAHTS